MPPLRQRLSLADIPIPPGVRAIVLDAVGTIIHPLGRVAEVYHRIGVEHGVVVDADKIEVRFRQALAVADWSDPRQPHQRELWRKVVTAVFPAASLSQREPLFQSLWDHFGRADAWALYPDVAPCWQRWTQDGYRLAIGSNFDDRIESVLAGLPYVGECPHVYWSSRMGFSKPARGFFDTIAGQLQLSPESLLMIGDDDEKDVQGAIAAGWHAAGVMTC